MRIRCRAIADPRSNALGVLELESTPEGLWLAYESVSSYREGYAPGPPALRSEHRVPWQCVRVSRVGSELLRLEVQEPRSPFSHFVLRDFAHAEPQAWLGRARAWSRLDAPRAVLTQLCDELALHLGSPVAREVSASGEPALERSSRLRSLPRSGVALLIVLCSAAIAGLLSTQTLAPPDLHGAHEHVPALSAPVVEALLQASPEPSAAQPVAAATVPAPATAREALNVLEQADLSTLPAPRLGGGCECIRHESVLWQPPPPRLTALVTKVELRAHGTHQHLELDLTVVNNGARELRGLTLGVQISTTRRDASDPEDDPVERSQYFPGPLAPGQLLSWHASARGDRFQLRLPELGRLDEDGIDAAPAAAYAELAAGPPGLMRLHGATMLAFLGHESAREALLRAREGLAEPELAHVERALATTGSLRICQVVVSEVERVTRTQSCLYNAGEVAQSDFELKVRAVRVARAPEGAPVAPTLVLAEETLDWSGTLPPRRGRRLELAIDLSRAGSSPEHRIELLAQSRARPE